MPSEEEELELECHTGYYYYKYFAKKAFVRLLDNTKKKHFFSTNCACNSIQYNTIQFNSIDYHHHQHELFGNKYSAR